METIPILVKGCLFHAVKTSDNCLLLLPQAADRAYKYCEFTADKIKPKVDILLKAYKDNPAVQKILQKYRTDTISTKINAYNLTRRLVALRKLQ